MSTTQSKKRTAIPGLIIPQQRVVTRVNSRAAAIKNQTELDLDAFRELSQSIKAMKEELETVRGRLLHTMVATKQARMLTADGGFAVTIKERSNWTYSDELQDKLDLLKAEQVIEQRRGIAINNPTVYIDGRSVAA